LGGGGGGQFLVTGKVSIYTAYGENWNFWEPYQRRSAGNKTNTNPLCSLEDEHANIALPHCAMNL